MINTSKLIREDREFLGVIDTLKEMKASLNRLPLVVNGLAGGAEDAFVTECVTELSEMFSGVTLILVGSDEDAVRRADELNASGISAYAYKSRNLVYHNISASRDTDRERLSVLSAIVSSRAAAVVTTPGALLSLTMPRARLMQLSLSLAEGDNISPEALMERLVGMGFTPCETVEGRGQVARRGGIVDFFTQDSEAPVRVEFFGDEIDRMVYFDPLSQRSGQICRSVELLPASEVIPDGDGRTRILSHIKKLIDSDVPSPEVKDKLRREMASVESGGVMDFRDKYINLIYPEGEGLLSYLEPRECPILIIGSDACRENLDASLKRLGDDAASLTSMGLISGRIAKFSLDKTEYERLISDNVCLHINPFAGGVGGMRASGLFGFRTRKCVGYGRNPSMLYEDLGSYRRALYRTLIICETKGGARSLADALSAEDFAPRIIEGDSLTLGEPGSITIAVGRGEGFDLITPRIAVLSMAEDTGKAVMANRRRARNIKRAGGSAKQIMSHAELTVGDYVVHASYGIGLFEGISTVTAAGVTKDYITVKYAGTDKLFVPCDRLEMIGKYIGARDSDGKVKLSKMGGTEWTRAKSRAKSAAKDVASKLISLYAERQRMAGFAFPGDVALETEFASGFEYEETESQLSAIAEISSDMMRPVPMNRLLCGDVGFGKTEVALRAAFKAILGNKQVAILVPTTILALQHYQTALSRMRSHPVNVEMLSRFRTPKERERIMRRVARGEVDILIGTHALLSKNLSFRDLGLLIIDEEQRFGVIQKEKLRQMAKNVDTLMLSATPIPRTLNMAMSGISDISVLDEAPGERRPVQTYVLEHDNAVIDDAITRELARGGQVLYLYNKVEDIDLVAGRIMNAHPMARVAFAHGKMEKDELEDIWSCLVRGEIDVLVCTTIIETGVDLPSANTLVIENADRFGLSQLHQIRGRVGRSERQAYAYFTYRPGKALSEEAEKRLTAIRDYAEFGAGFKIALRDLEIRGAGNLLGAEQHGYIESVGYDLYIKLLNEAVLEERGEKIDTLPEAQVVMNLSANIPESYIASSQRRMEMYKKISHIRCTEDAEDVLDELIDRFGAPPTVTQRLVKVALIKALATEAGLKKVELGDCRLTFVSDKPDLASWSVAFSKTPGLSFLGAGSPIVAYKLRRDEEPTGRAVSILEDYCRERRQEQS